MHVLAQLINAIWRLDLFSHQIHWAVIWVTIEGLV